VPCQPSELSGLAHLKTHGPSEAVRIGSCCLWIDLAPHLGRAELWLELQADDTTVAAAHLARHGLARCDEIERLPDGLWVVNPAGIVHLVAHMAKGPGPLMTGQRA
jgi:hypothetical protein